MSSMNLLGSSSLLFMYGQTFDLRANWFHQLKCGYKWTEVVGNWFIAMITFVMQRWMHQVKGLTISGFLKSYLTEFLLKPFPHEPINPPMLHLFSSAAPPVRRVPHLSWLQILRTVTSNSSNPGATAHWGKRSTQLVYQRAYKFWIPLQYKKLGGVHKGGSDMFTSLLGIFSVM